MKITTLLFILAAGLIVCIPLIGVKEDYSLNQTGAVLFVAGLFVSLFAVKKQFKFRDQASA